MSGAAARRACSFWNARRMRDGRQIEMSFGMWCDACCGPLSRLDSTLSRAAYSRAWRSIHSLKPRSDTGIWSMSVGPEPCRRVPFASRYEIWLCSTTRAGAGCWGQRTASGTGGRTSGGCRRIRRGGWSVRRAGTTTSGGIASAWSVVSGWTARRHFRIVRTIRRCPKPDARLVRTIRA